MINLLGKKKLRADMLLVVTERLERILMGAVNVQFIRFVLHCIH